MTAIANNLVITFKTYIKIS